MPSDARIAVLLVVCVAAAGCRQNPNQPGIAWPWNNSQAAKRPAQDLATANQPPANWPELSQMLQRESEQSRLSDIQRSQLERLTQYWEQQQAETTRLTEAKREEQLAKLQSQTQELQQMEAKLAQLEQLRRQTLELDNNNRDLHAQLAKADQEKRLLEDQVQLIKQQLSGTTSQLQMTMQEKQLTDSQVTAMQANLQKRSRASISANSSALRKLEPVQISGLLVRQDGDVIRIELPSDQIFAPQTAAINPQGQAIIDQIAAAVGTNYARQKIGIEAHTDSSTAIGSSWRSLHQLSAAQAMAVFDYLAQRHRYNPRQMFVLGHGANYPIADNATSTGQQRNRRVEVVIYPETVDE